MSRTHLAARAIDIGAARIRAAAEGAGAVLRLGARGVLGYRGIGGNVGGGDVARIAYLRTGIAIPDLMRIAGLCDAGVRTRLIAPDNLASSVLRQCKVLRV